MAVAKKTELRPWTDRDKAELAKAIKGVAERVDRLVRCYETLCKDQTTRAAHASAALKAENDRLNGLYRKLTLSTVRAEDRDRYQKAMLDLMKRQWEDPTTVAKLRCGLDKCQAALRDLAAVTRDTYRISCERDGGEGRDCEDAKALTRALRSKRPLRAADLSPAISKSDLVTGMARFLML